MTISIRLTPDEEARLEQLSQKTGRSKSFYVRQALQEHLEDLEDTFLADQILDEWKASGAPTRPFSELKAELGL